LIQIIVDIITLCVIFFQCTGGQITGGSETTNGINITVAENNLLINGPVGSNVEFYLSNCLPSNNTGPLTSIELNYSGSASLDSFASGNYNVLFRMPFDSMMGIIQAVSVPKKVKISWHDNMEFPASLSGKLIISSTRTIHGSVVVYLIGTPFFEKLNLEDTIMQYNFKRIPPGTYTCQYEFTEINPNGVILGIKQGTLQTITIKSKQSLNIQEPIRLP
jgi:hypothetical protein